MATAHEQNESPALHLARYLKEFVALRSTTVRDVAAYDSVLWFADMPQEPDCSSGAWSDEPELGDPWLEVKKQEFEPPPPAPTIILSWVDAKALKQAAEFMPALRQTILVALAALARWPTVATGIGDRAVGARRSGHR
jgi:hypothetical protein